MGWRWWLAVVLCGVSGRAATWYGPPPLGQGKAHLASSADPTGGNNDRGNYLRREGSRVVLMEADGPGVITRIWSANPAGTLRIFFDGEPKPRVELPFDQLGTLSDTTPRAKAYCSVAGGGVSCCYPMRFAKHARVEAEGVDQLYYQVDYTTGSGDQPTFTPGPAEGLGLPKLKLPTPTASEMVVPAGGRAVVSTLSGAGCLGELAFRPSPDTLTVLRTLRVQLTWDDASGPSVDVPLGDLVCAGLGRPRSAGQAGWSPSEGYYLVLPMPYRSRAVVALANAGSQPVSVKAQVFGQSDSCDGYFCATGHASTTVAGQPHTLLEVSGAGRYVGTAVTLVGGEDLKFLEGDETLVVDGAETLQGTGTEDYFDGAWFFRRGPFADAFAGAPVLLAGKTRVAAYRWHLQDSIPFAKSLKAVLEHGAANDAAGSCYRSVAYWYSATPYVSAPMPIAEPLPPFTEKADDRRIVEAESLLDKIKKPEGAELAVTGDEGLPYQASGGKVLSYTLRDGAPLVLPLTVASSGLWEVGLRGGDAESLHSKLAGDGWVTADRAADSLGYRRVDKGELQLTLSGSGHDAIDYLWLREVGKIRGALEAEELKATCSGGEAKPAVELPKAVLRSPALVGGAVPTEAVCSGGAALRYLPAKAGDRCDVAFDIKEDGEVGLAASWVQGPNQGSAKLLIDGHPAGSVSCRNEAALVGARYGLGTWRLTAGTHRLSMVANEARPLELDYLLLKPAQRGQEAECFVPLGGSAATLVVKERFGAEPKWSGGAYIKAAAQPGKPVRLGLTAGRAGRYQVRLVEAKVPGGAKASVSLNGRAVGTLDCQGAGEKLGQGLTATVNLRAGLNELALSTQAAGDVALDVAELTYLGRPLWQKGLAGLLVLLAAAALVLRRRGRRQAA